MNHAPTLPREHVPSTGPARAAFAVEKWLGGSVELLCALLIAAEIVILLAGVVARYFLHTPLVWTDEVASILFLWLASLGAVVAFRRGEHMRMKALMLKASPRTQAFLDAVAIAAALAFLLLVVGPAYEYAGHEVGDHHPGAGDLQRLARRRAAGRPGADGADGVHAPARDGRLEARRAPPSPPSSAPARCSPCSGRCCATWATPTW